MRLSQPTLARRFLGVALALLVLLTFGESTALIFRTGITGYSGKMGVDCTICHSGGNVPIVTLDGPSHVAPGSKIVYKLTIAEGQKIAGGLNVAADGGKLAIVEFGTQILNDEVTHTTPRMVNGQGVVEFKFQWTAPPASGFYRLYAAGNSVNLNSMTSGDNSATVVLDVRVGDFCRVDFLLFGHGLAGTGGIVPRIEGHGGHCTDFWSIDISKTLGGASSLLWVGTNTTRVPLLGGDFYIDLSSPYVAVPLQLLGPAGQGGAGFLHLPGIDVSAYEGLEIPMQLMVLDPGAVQGAAFTSGMAMRIGR